MSKSFIETLCLWVHMDGFYILPQFVRMWTLHRALQHLDQVPDQLVPKFATIHDGCIFLCLFLIGFAFFVQAFLEIQYNFYRTSIFQKNWEHDAVLLYRMKHAEEFHEHVAVIPYRCDLNLIILPIQNMWEALFNLNLVCILNCGVCDALEVLCTLYVFQVSRNMQYDYTFHFGYLSHGCLPVQV